MHKVQSTVVTIVLLLGVSIPLLANSTSDSERVRKQLAKLSYFTVLDNLTFQVDGDTVILGGQVVRPTLKTSAERVVAEIEGVVTVQNQIEVLPLSPNDDRIRQAAFRAIYSQPSLFKYANRAVPTIHIVVKNGHLFLEGKVNTQAEKQLAYFSARSVPGVFSVTNNMFF